MGTGLRDLEFKTNMVYTGELVSTKKNRKFLLQIETITGAHNWSKYRVYLTPGYPSLKWDIYNIALHSRHQEHEGRRWKYSRRTTINSIFWA